MRSAMILKLEGIQKKQAYPEGTTRFWGLPYDSIQDGLPAYNYRVKNRSI
jgi:hypothetical protein